MKRVYFVRHGETEGNIGGFSQDHATPLTTRGVSQAETVSTRFGALAVDTVLASKYDRAQATAQPIAVVCDCDVVTTEYFHEVENPSWVRNKPHDSEEYIRWKKELQANYTDPEWRCDDAENFQDLLDRVSAGITSLENSPQENIVVVTHGRLLRFIAAYLLHQRELSAAIELQTSHSMFMTNTGITVFDYDGDVWKMITWNDHAHFAE